MRLVTVCSVEDRILTTVRFLSQNVNGHSGPWREGTLQARIEGIA